MTIEVGGDDARLGLSVLAASIRQAASVAQALYAGAQIRVIFPIEPETFFVIDSAASVWPVELETPQTIARYAIC